MKIHEDILAGNDPKSWTFSDEIVSVSYSKTEASGQPTFTLQDHDFKATGWKTMIAYDEIHTNKVLKQFFIISLFGGITSDVFSIFWQMSSGSKLWYRDLRLIRFMKSKYNSYIEWTNLMHRKKKLKVTH